jgi:hypothetical protein
MNDKNVMKKLLDDCTTTHHTALHQMAGRLENKTVRLSKQQIAGLKKQAAMMNRYWTELIRLAVDEFIETRRNGVVQCSDGVHK